MGVGELLLLLRLLLRLELGGIKIGIVRRRRELGDKVDSCPRLILSDLRTCIGYGKLNMNIQWNIQPFSGSWSSVYSLILRLLTTLEGRPPRKDEEEEEEEVKFKERVQDLGQLAKLGAKKEAARAWFVFSSSYLFFTSQPSAADDFYLILRR